MKRPFFRTFFITVVSTTEDFSPTANCSSLFGKTFSCLPIYNYLFVSFLIRFSMNNRIGSDPCGSDPTSAPTYLPVLLPAKYFRLSGA